VTAPAVRTSPIHTATVVANAALTPRMRRVTVRSEAMVGADIRPAQDVELHLLDPGGRKVKRRYTIRRLRPDSGEMDLDVLLHGAGPGSTWGQAAAPGDAVRFQGPRGKLEVRRAPTHLLAGDESALPAIAAVAESLPPDERAVCLVEVQDETDHVPVAGDVTWVHRGAVAPGTPDLLLAALARVPVDAGTHAYLMGETRSMVAIRAALEARGVAHEAIFVKGYWNIARPDRVAGRAPSTR
jgi:NADPH-dependent ferric siderophore reductase